MSDIPYAGFDPIFWLHHAYARTLFTDCTCADTAGRNVDRLFAIWQALYPDSYTTPQADAYGTFTNSPGETEDVNTRMSPDPHKGPN